jgi:EpsI family protein
VENSDSHLSGGLKLRHYVFAVAMGLSSLIAWGITPHEYWAAHIGSPRYASELPTQFGDWRQVESGDSNSIVDPQLQEAVENLYTQTVSRLYVHVPTGRTFMLSAAYGDVQTFSKQLHRPESCYSSQGFKIKSLLPSEFRVGSHEVSTMRMTAIHGPRNERVTYFIRIGDQVIKGPASALNYARLHMGLKGYISDGLLFRISEITEDLRSSDQLQDEFLTQLVEALPSEKRRILIGG